MQIVALTYFLGGQQILFEPLLGRHFAGWTLPKFVEHSRKGIKATSLGSYASRSLLCFNLPSLTHFISIH